MSVVPPIVRDQLAAIDREDVIEGLESGLWTLAAVGVGGVLAIKLYIQTTLIDACGAPVLAVRNACHEAMLTNGTDFVWAFGGLAVATAVVAGAITRFVDLAENPR